MIKAEACKITRVTARPGETVGSCGCVFWGSHPGASLPIRVRSCSGCAQLSECMHVLSREGQSLYLMCSARCAPLGGAVHVLKLTLLSSREEVRTRRPWYVPKT